MAVSGGSGSGSSSGSNNDSLQALGDETDFTKPHTMRVIEKFLVDCSEAVSTRYTR